MTNMAKILIVLFLFSPLLLSAQADSIGVYMKNGNVISKIDPIKYIQTKSNALASAFTYGIVSTTMKTVFRDAVSANKANADTKFYFYFKENINPNIMQTYFMFTADHTPKDFIIAKFTSKKNTRELSWGKVNIYSGIRIGVADETNAELNTIKKGDGLYEISFTTQPESGEYCFMYLGPNGSGSFLPVFEFSIE